MVKLVVSEIEIGLYLGNLVYIFILYEEVCWDNGILVIGEDMVFMFKVLFNLLVLVVYLCFYFDFIVSVEVDKVNFKMFMIIM